MSESLAQIAEVLGPEAVGTMHDAVAQIALVAGSEGLQVSRADIEALECVKLLVMGDVPLDLSKALRELKDLPHVQEQVIIAKNDKAAMDAHNKALAGLSPGEKLNYARANGLDGKKAPPSAPKGLLSPEEIVRAFPSRAARMAYARRHGLA